MGQIKILKNVIRHYAWGSFTAIPELLNVQSSSDLPCAELWLGAHPAAPSQINHKGQSISLDSFIRQYPEEVLGQPTAAKFGDTLPFLFKVLAAARPLSIQAHPDSDQARRGFLRENRTGVPIDSPQRNYKDPNHKPECICALTPFSALCGFRDFSDILNNFSTVLSEPGRNLTVEIENHPDSDGLRAFFQRLLVVDTATAQELLTRAVDYAGSKADDDAMCRWVIRLNEAYPDDIMALAPLFLNLLELLPQQALFLPAGVLHSYLEGVGVELMANSDNVLRGGLTPKKIDVNELLDVLDFSPGNPAVLLPVDGAGCERLYDTAAEEFVLSIVRVLPGQPCSPLWNGRVAILLCLEGNAVITEENNGETTALNKGVSVIIPASVDHCTISGDAVIYKAAVPL